MGSRASLGIPTLAGIIFAVLVAAMALPKAASSQEWQIFMVTTTADALDASPGDCVCDDGTGRCSFRGAVMEANACPGAQSIILRRGTYTLDLVSEGDVRIEGDVSIQGAGRGTTFLDGGGIDRVLHIASGIVRIYDLTVRNGVTSGYGGGILAEGGSLFLMFVDIVDNRARGGGGLLTQGNVIADLYYCVVSGNQSTNSAGGGILVMDSSTAGIEGGLVSDNKSFSTGGGISNLATAQLDEVTLSGNYADTYGGGIFNNGTLTAANCTVSGNSAGMDGGGLKASADQQTILDSVTLSGNSAGDNGGGIWLSDHTLLVNTLVAGNTARYTPASDCAGSGGSNGHNLVGIYADCFSVPQATDLRGTLAAPLDPKLGPLAANGGLNVTHALLKGSPALEAGDTAEGIDERWAPRPGGAADDIGAYEKHDFGRVSLVFPNGGELFQADGNINVWWGAPERATKFNLDYSVDDGLTWSPIASSVGGTAFAWRVPGQPRNRYRCRVRVSGFNRWGGLVGSDRSDDPFAIEAVRVIYPDFSRTLKVGASCPIIWRTYRTGATVRQAVIMISSDSGATWNRLAVRSGNPEIVYWVPPGPIYADKGRIKVILKSTLGRVVGLAVSAPFSACP